MRGEDIAERLLDLAARVLKLSEAMQEGYSGRHIALQMVRSVTSAGANYEEARCAESRADLKHKLNLALKELQETRYWLRLTGKAGIIAAKRLNGVIEETSELIAILVASGKTLGGKKSLSQTTEQ